MKALFAMVLALSLGAAARADFSYTTTQKTTGGMMAGLAGGAASKTSKYYLKGQKLKVDNGSTAMIIDFDAQTITTINTAQKTYAVRNFDDVSAGTKSAGVEMKIDAKETGQKKVVNGFNASELVLTMDIESPQAQQGKMQMEMDMWLSADVPGNQELRAFYQRNAGKFPWAAMMAGGNPSMQKALADVQRKLASMNGVPVEQVVRVKASAMDGMAGRGPSPAQMEKMQAGMAEACAKMEAMKAQGGPSAAMIQQQMAKMCGGPAPGATSASSSGALLEMTITSSEFSTAGIPDSVFVIPAGLEKSK